MGNQKHSHVIQVSSHFMRSTSCAKDIGITNSGLAPLRIRCCTRSRIRTRLSMRRQLEVRRQEEGSDGSLGVTYNVVLYLSLNAQTVVARDNIIYSLMIHLFLKHRYTYKDVNDYMQLKYHIMPK